MTCTAYIAIGGNVGDRLATLEKAVEMLGLVSGVAVMRRSQWIQTPPWGPVPQPHYLNGVVEVETTLEPLELLAELQKIEKNLGRDRAREQRWGPRSCDLDIILMGDLMIDLPELTIPHPRMHERLFVLEPLAELAPHAMHPVLKKTVRELLDGLRGGGA